MKDTIPAMSLDRLVWTGFHPAEYYDTTPAFRMTRRLLDQVRDGRHLMNQEGD